MPVKDRVSISVSPAIGKALIHIAKKTPGTSRPTAAEAVRHLVLEWLSKKKGAKTMLVKTLAAMGRNGAGK